MLPHRRIFMVRVQCVKSVRIRSVTGPYFSVFGLNMEIYRVNLCIQSECGEIWKYGNIKYLMKRFKLKSL